MFRIRRVSIVSSIAVLISIAGCAGVNPVVEGDPIAVPDQHLDREGPTGKTRVIFYNTTNVVVWPTSHRIVVTLNGEVSPPIASRKYFQIYLDKGDYDIVLTHWDIFTFTDQYRFRVAGDTLNVRLFNTPLGTKYEVVNELPDGFTEDYEPAIDDKST